jgi:hypothetical protein
MSEEQARLQEELVARYDRLRTSKVDPREDNALAITTDGRKLALDARLLTAAACDNPASKINAMVTNVVAVCNRTAAGRGTQMIFCDMGVNPTPWGYCVYDEIIAKLAAAGIPRDQIAAIGEADSDAKKQALFERVRSGAVRVLAGSTQKMGTGTNVQKRLVALHHLDAPWKPAEVEQRDGRILRQGNGNPEVSIYRYVTTGSFDSYIWQALETKARFISQVITGHSAVRQAQDIGGEELSYAEVKAIASGNPAVLTLAKADAELQRLAILRKNHADEQYVARRALRELPQTIERLTKRLKDLGEDLSTISAHPDRRITLDGRTFLEGDAAKALANRLEASPQRLNESRTIPLGVYRGLRFGLVYHAQGGRVVFVEGAFKREQPLFRDAGARAILNALERLADNYQAQVAMAQRELDVAEAQLRDYRPRVGKVFPHEAYTVRLTELRDELKRGLSESQEAEKMRPAAEIAADIEHLKATSLIEPLTDDARLTSKRHQRLERPVTTRIRERIDPSLKEPAQPEPEATGVKDTPVIQKTAPVALPRMNEISPQVTKPRPRTQYQRQYQVQRRLF